MMDVKAVIDVPINCTGGSAVFWGIKPGVLRLREDGICCHIFIVATWFKPEALHPGFY
jgi:hypothetical protein